MKSPRSPRQLAGLAGLALAASLAISSSSSAHAQDLCFPKPRYVPGLSGPPKWYATAPETSGLSIWDLNELRWGASAPERFFNDQNVSNATGVGRLRMIRSASGRYLYVSMQAHADSTISADDFVSFGLLNPGSNQGAVLKIQLTTGAVDPYPPAMIRTYSWTGGSTWLNDTLNASDPKVQQNRGWLVAESPALFTHHPVIEGGADWGVQFIIDLSRLGITEAQPQFKIFTAMKGQVVQGSNDSWVLSTPRRTKDYACEVAETLIPCEHSEWLAENLVEECADGVSFDSSEQIGTVIPNRIGLASEITTVAGKVNKFSAQPKWPATKADGSPFPQPGDLRAGDIQARFRINDWGAQVEGMDIFKDVPGLTAVNADGNGHFTKDCPVNGNGFACGNAAATALNPNAPMQCMAVELSSSAGVPIKTPVIYRNMNVVELSTRTLPAKISIRGLRAATGRGGDRDVIVDVITRNMPSIGNIPSFLDAGLLNYLKLLAIGIINELNPFGLSLTPDDQMKMAWPTYEAHTYYDTFRTRTHNGKTYREFSPMNSFGYHFAHTGVYFGFTHTIGGGGLKPAVANTSTYRTRVADEGSVTVTTGVRTEDLPAILVNTVNLACRIFPFCAR